MTKKSSQNQPKTPPNGQKKTDETIEIFGVAITGTHLASVLKKIFVQRKEMIHVATVNPEFIMEARHNDIFHQVLKKSEVTVADGWGVVWAARILEPPFSNSPVGESVHMERISGMDLIKNILEHANARGEKVFLLGAQPGVAEKAANEMKKKYQSLEIAWYEGARTVQVEKKEEASMTIAKINAYEPDYLLVAYGSPWQDMWIEENRPYLRVRVAIGVGGALDEWAGVVPTCPQWLDRLGGKWLWRLVTEPWRWRRILRVIGFGMLVIMRKVSSSFALRATAGHHAIR